jgi:hypothetical protein
MDDEVFTDDFTPPQHGARFLRPIGIPLTEPWRGCVVDLRLSCGWRFAGFGVAYADALAWVRGEA